MEYIIEIEEETVEVVDCDDFGWHNEQGI